MSKNNYTNRKHSIIIIISTMISLFCLYLSVTNKIDKSNLIAKYMSISIIIEYFIVWFWRWKSGLYKKDPDYNFVIEHFWNLNLLFAVITLMKTFYSNNENIYKSLYYFSIFIVLGSTIIRIHELIKYSKNGKIFIICLFLTIFLGTGDEKIQVILTLATTLLMIFFGEIVIKKFFSEQIISYEKHADVKNDSILEDLEYKFALICMLIIFIQIVVAITGFLKEISCTIGLKGIYRILMIGITRFSILGILYIRYRFKDRQKIKEKIFKSLLIGRGNTDKIE